MKNNNGTAPGVIIEKEGKVIIMLPGPPGEMIPMWESSVREYLEKRQDSTMVSKVIRLCGIGESFAANEVRDLLDSENPTVAPYAKSTECQLRITARGKNKEEAIALIKPVSDEIYKRLGANIYAEDDTDLQTTIYGLISEKNMSLAIAESCTGGLLTSAFVSVAGISSVLKEGIVAYSNESKVSRLGVAQETLDKYGAVSHETAREMAAGATRISGSDIGISTTGVAGPSHSVNDGEKPVGLCYVGICINGKTLTQEYNILGDRNRIRNRVVMSALILLWEELRGC
jgi:nicotinamide-nucleotide amidase